MDQIDEEGFRANVGIIVCDARDLVLVGGRVGQDAWQFPQGGIRVDESPEEAMYRELREEVGLTPADVAVLGSTDGWLRYRLPEQFVRRRRRPVCIGQKQRWFLLRMRGGEDRLRFDVTAKPEFDAWRWVDYWSPVREVIYFKRRVYARALDELADWAFPSCPPPRPEWWSAEVEPAPARSPRREPSPPAGEAVTE